MAASRSILVVAQVAPPSPLVGARRPAALVRELSRRSHRVSLLTSMALGEGPVDHAARTVRARDLLATPLNWRRGNLAAQQGAGGPNYQEASPVETFVVPDVAAVSWVPFALARARGLAAREQIDCVITTGPPHSAHLVGLALSRLGIAWVADLRDGWTFDPPHGWASPLLGAADRMLEAAVLRRADRVVTVTEPISQDLRDRLEIAAETITNGFDPGDEISDDLDGIVRPDRFTIAYTGRLGVAGRRPRALLDGVCELHRRHPEMERPPELVFAGAMTRDEAELLGEPRYADIARTLGTLERSRALALQRAADALVVIAAGEEGRPAPSVATGKLFEYLGARRPVLVLGDETEAARIIERAGAGLAVPVGDADAVASALERLVAGAEGPTAEAVEPYSWPRLAVTYEQLVEDAIASARA